MGKCSAGECVLCFISVCLTQTESKRYPVQPKNRAGRENLKAFLETVCKAKLITVSFNSRKKEYFKA